MPIGHNIKGVQAGMSQKGFVNVTIRPLPVILAGQFGALAVSVRSFRVPLERSVRHVMIPSIKKNFEAEGRPAWTELSGFTIDRRAQEGYPPGPILQRSGRMRRAAIALARWKYTKDTAFMGGDFPATAKYGPIHQIADIEDVFGGVDNSQYLPGRPFAVVQPEDSEKIQGIFSRWFKERALAVGLPTIP